MALDEVLLGAMPELGRPVLRYYGWHQPAASFGYFQKYADVEKMTRLRPLVRRPTGGGLVPHDVDWTYSVAVPTSESWYQLGAKESYERMHRWLQSAFGRLKIVTELAAQALRAGPGQCFVGYEQFDLLWNGVKVAGAAQRRTRQGLLIQGSVQPPSPARFLARKDWQEAMMASGAGEARFASPPQEERARERRPVLSHATGDSWKGRLKWLKLENESELTRKAQNLAEAKYSQSSHNQRR